METQNENTNGEKLNFDADISQLMNLIVHAFYSKHEIFLRELLSNSSDALEKLRYESLTDKTVLDSEPELKIKIWPDQENKTLIIEDTGIGMTKNDMVNNLGTIAKSGTKEFLKRAEKGEIDQIGQFGVGFYSSFLVADKVTVYSKHNDDAEHVWESSADQSYTIRENETPSLKRGTRIVLHLKEIEHDEYLNTDNIKEVVKKYTQFISFPIELQETKEIEEEVEVEEPEKVEESAEEKLANEEIEAVVEENKTEDEKVVEENAEATEAEKVVEEKKKTKTVKRKVKEWNVLNEQKPIWCRNSSEITEEEYNKFYKSINNDYSDPMAHKHFHAEVQLDFNCLLYVPNSSPLNMFEVDNKKKNLKLYVKRIFIMDDCDDLIPEWLKFMKGVIDSDDIPLNVSRELLQQNRIIRQIKKVVVKKSIELFNELAEDKDKYKKFYDSYSKMIKYGVHEDKRHSKSLLKLLRFYSAEHPDEYISLDDYVENMKEGQDSIYFISGVSKNSIESSPFIEGIREKGYDVLYFLDPIDEYLVQSVKEYESKNLVDVSKEGIEFNEEELKKKKEENEDLLKFMKETLGDRVTEVRVSDRLKDTPCVLVTSKQGYSANMERLLKAQALRNSQMDMYMAPKKILEINIDHKIMKTLKVRSKDENSINQSKDVVLLLYDTSQINSGFVLEKPSDYANKVNRMVELGFCNDDDEEEEEDELPELEEEGDDEDNDMETVD